MGTNNNPNGNLNEKLGGEYPNRAIELSQQAMSDYDPNMAPVYAGPVVRNEQVQVSNQKYLKPISVPTMMVYAGPDVMSGNKPKTSDKSTGALVPGVCPSCGTQNQTGAKFCENCGSLLTQ